MVGQLPPKVTVKTPILWKCGDQIIVGCSFICSVSLSQQLPDRQGFSRCPGIQTTSLTSDMWEWIVTKCLLPSAFSLVKQSSVLAVANLLSV